MSAWLSQGMIKLLAWVHLLPSHTAKELLQTPCRFLIDQLYHYLVARKKNARNAAVRIQVVNIEH
jgi:hypothetical protein